MLGSSFSDIDFFFNIETKLKQQISQNKQEKLVNQWCIKKDKNVFQLAFRLHAFLQIPEMLETHAEKKLNFQHYCKTKMLQIGETSKLKCRGNFLP